MSNWHPGDLSASAIVTSLGYAALAAGCCALSRRRDGPEVWWVLAALWLAIAVARQLGLFEGAGEGARAAVVAAGDYAEREALQIRMLGLLAIVAIGIGGGLSVWATRAGRCAAAMALTVVGATAFLAVRAVSLHAIDAVLYRRIGGIALGNGVEAGIVAAGGVILGLAWRFGRKRRGS